MKLSRSLATTCFLVSSCLALSCQRQPTQTSAEAPAEKRIASTDVVKVEPRPVEITAGGSAEADVRLVIQNGYHVNANPPSEPYLKATEIEMPPSEGVSVGFIVYPDPLTKTFSFSERPLAVYEGETHLKVNLKADSSAKKGERHLSAKLRIQACDDQVCYPPGVMNLTIPVNVR